MTDQRVETCVSAGAPQSYWMRRNAGSLKESLTLLRRSHSKGNPMKPIVPAFAVALSLAAAACGGNNDLSGAQPTALGSNQADRVSSFDGDILRLEFSRPDGSRESFNSVRDDWFTWSWRPFLPNHSGRRWTLLKTSAETSSIAYALVSWNNDDPTDYLAAGYWLEFPHEDGRFRRFDLANASAHPPFVDGPELDPSSSPSMPVSGTARYAGPVGGLYSYRYGSGWSAVDEPSVTEEFTGTMTIHADFADNSLTGCIGCIGDIEITRENLYTVLGFRRAEPLALPNDYELHFARTPISANGAFESAEVEVIHPKRAVVESEGSWSGRFSHIPDTDGNPRLAAGMTDVTFTEVDASLGKFMALFTTPVESLAQPVPSPAGRE